ncbi:hypothetical protein AGLY_011236 [Aphis glycines]|uniref:Uncharacterized protein n=1 Tax=Aphis glycines TaxID=307491 RepID=A0A6G0TE74_APHGL|nr:hypothetical protein AGLY_011236 [Aphis glycines]
MRFLCVCVAVLSALLAVRCFVFMPNPSITRINILRGVLANDREWKDIIGQAMNVNALDSGSMLTDMGLRKPSTTKITPQKIIEHLVVHKGSTGQQLAFGIRVLGIACEIQFVKTLVAHSLLAARYTDQRSSTPWSLRVCISSIQQALVVFANKVAFFGHDVDFFLDLNSIINEFLKENSIALELRKLTSDILRNQISTFFATISNKAHDRLAIMELVMETEEIMNNIFNINNDISDYDAELHYSLINNINFYKVVDVSTFRLEFGEKVFEIIKYTDNSLVKKEKTETEIEIEKTT